MRRLELNGETLAEWECAAVQPMSVTIARDIYTIAERAKRQGYLASV